MTSPESAGAHAIETQIGYRFKDPLLLQEALTHSSKSPREKRSYERLEFLGDAVLGMAIADHLFRHCPEGDEGELTKMKSAIVCAPVLRQAARRLHLELHALVDKAISARGLPPSLLSDIYEALIGALYLDGGLDEARRFILTTLEPEIADVIAGKVTADAKSLLQLYAHRELGIDPVYHILEESGPAHKKQFRAAVIAAGTEYQSEWAGSKSAAEQLAAALALRELGVKVAAHKKKTSVRRTEKGPEGSGDAVPPAEIV